MEWLGSRYRDADIAPPDLEALTLILAESMAAYRELGQVSGRVPGAIDDDRFVYAWVDATLAIAERYGLN